MRCQRCISFVAVMACCSSIAAAQFKQQTDMIGERTADIPTTERSVLSNMTQGFAASFRPWDLSLLGLTGMYLIKPDEADDQLSLRPLAIDHQISRSLGRNGEGELVGSRLHPAGIQRTIFLGHLGIVAFLDIATGASITSRDYETPLVFAKAMMYTYGITEITKNWVKRNRPDGSDNRSFFSGHVSGSFAMSAFVYREVSDAIDGMEAAERSTPVRMLLKGVSFTAAYGWATYVGYSRIHDRRHYFSDVLVGAAVGTVIGNLLYDLHFGANSELQSPALQFRFIPADRPTIAMSFHF